MKSRGKYDEKSSSQGMNKRTCVTIAPIHFHTSTIGTRSCVPGATHESTNSWIALAGVFIWIVSWYVSGSVWMLENVYLHHLFNLNGRIERKCRYKARKKVHENRVYHEPMHISVCHRGCSSRRLLSTLLLKRYRARTYQGV